jgi:hypothetical protein
MSGDGYDGVAVGWYGGFRRSAADLMNGYRTTCSRQKGDCRDAFLGE